MRSDLIILVTMLLAVTGAMHRANAQGTAFTYQGRLSDGASAANGTYEFRFALFDAVSNGNQIGNAVTNSGVAVNAGSFTTTLNFGAGVFPGANRWLQIAVRTNGGGADFTTFNPRQALAATPYAQTAGDVTSANISRLNVPNTAMQATGVPTVNFGFVVNATVTGGGSGYVTPPTVTVNDATGSGAAITASISSGAVVGLTVNSPGNGYSANATLTIAAPPNNAFQTFVTPNYFTGANTMNNANNVFAGTFAGNGAGLTGISGSSIAGGQVVKSLNGLSDTVTLSAGANITLTPTGNSVQIASSASGGVSWQVVPGTTQQAQANTGYLLANNAQVTVTLPASPNPGEFVRLSGNGPGGWRIAQNANQSVLVRNLPGNVFGTSWTPRDSDRWWSGVASSADGIKLVAVGAPDHIYTSTNSGVTWTPRESGRNWICVASSGDGTKLVAGVSNGQIYTSTDSGQTWTPHDSNRAWKSVASSADGTKLVAVGGGQIYTSTDSGLLWIPRGSIREWTCVASSADGNKLVAAATLDAIYTSTDSGVTWTARDASRFWVSVASSADGTKLVAAESDADGGLIYTSTDSGVTWTPHDSERLWTSVASSSDGSKLIGVVSPGRIYISTDSGATWTPRFISFNWTGVASSSDGSKLVAVVNGFGPGGKIYTSVPSSTVGTEGYLIGDPESAVELQYIGNGQFMPLSHEGTIIAH